MTVFEATLQYGPANRQSWFFSDDRYMRAQNMVWVLVEPKSPGKQRQPVRIIRFRPSASPSRHRLNRRHENDHRSDPCWNTPNLHSLQ